MRRFRYALLAVPFVLPVFVACEENSNNTSSSGGFTVPEGGGFEAGPEQDSGPFQEASTDAPIDNFVPPKGAKVTVTKSGTPQKDVRVIAHDATGAITSEVKTDATGVASFAAAPNMITVLTRIQGSSPAALTYLGVADGDVMNVAIPDFFGEPPPFAQFTTSANAFVGASSYSFNVSDNCSGFTNTAGTTTTINLYTNCLGAQNAVLGTAYDGEGFPIGFGFLKNQAKPAMGATVALPAISFTARGTLTQTASNIPANTYTDAELASIANGFGYYTGNRSGSLSGGGVTYPIATGFADAYQSLVVATSDNGPISARAILRRDASNNTATQTLAFDFATALPAITNGVVSGAVPSRPDVTLTAAASLAATDGGIVRLRWNLAQGVIPQSGWSFVVPPGTTTLKVPALPTDTDAAAFLPQAGATVRDAMFLESTLLPGYSQLKTLPINSDGEPPVGISNGTPLPANGTVKATVYNRYIISPPG
ncbi:MAG: hypothetical protein JST00_31045 [Deltaproteobacteria bacterium]|nr:hypothetical protein [Deltaproteobacteria bacterium]